MLDIPSISAIVAAIGVLIGVALTVLELRHLHEQKQTDLVTGLYAVISSKEFLEAWEKIRDREIKSYSDYKEKYGFVELNQVVAVFEEVGVLLQRRLVDIDLVNALLGETVISVWEKVKPITSMSGRPQLEYLYNEMKKRKQSTKT